MNLLIAPYIFILLNAQENDIVFAGSGANELLVTELSNSAY